MAFVPGERLGSYHILSALGAGGMGEVYRARHATAARRSSEGGERVGLVVERARRNRCQAPQTFSYDSPSTATITDVEVRFLTSTIAVAHVRWTSPYALTGMASFAAGAALAAYAVWFRRRTRNW